MKSFCLPALLLGYSTRWRWPYSLGFITSEGLCELLIIDGCMNSAKYKKMLEVVMFPPVSNLLGESSFIQQDNASCHKAKQQRSCTIPSTFL